MPKLLELEASQPRLVGRWRRHGGQTPSARSPARFFDRRLSPFLKRSCRLAFAEHQARHRLRGAARHQGQTPRRPRAWSSAIAPLQQGDAGASWARAWASSQPIGPPPSTRIPRRGQLATGGQVLPGVSLGERPPPPRCRESVGQESVRGAGGQHDRGGCPAAARLARGGQGRPRSPPRSRGSSRRAMGRVSTSPPRPPCARRLVGGAMASTLRTPVSSTRAARTSSGSAAVRH